MPISEEQKMIINPILHIGPLIIERNVAYNSFLIQMKQLNILIDIPPIQVVKVFKTEIEQYIEIKKMTHIVIQQVNASTLDSLKELLVDGFRGIILTNQYFAKQLSSISKIVKIQVIDSMNCELVFKDQFIFKFIPMNFLPFPEMFMTYIPMNQALFSSSLFSSYYDGILLPSLNHIKNSIFSYHKSNMPNSTFLQEPLRIVHELNIKTIYPTMGYIITNQIIENIMEFEIQLDFYNNYQVFFYDDAGEKCINYREIINHMINHLQKSYPKIEILNAFVGTSMNLQPDPLMLNKTTLDGYKLWHSFFENIYVKKGLSWITILEPLVNRYYSDYSIPKPNVYLSKFIEMSMRADSLKQSNDELVLHIEELNNEIENTMDRFMRCPITKLYNQDFFQ
ncbi:MAG: hypothetical protein KKH01_10080 [Firmicutes bacterium]|nr:hypothetical protein [Bacillota bacterium]